MTRWDKGAAQASQHAVLANLLVTQHMALNLNTLEFLSVK